MSAQPGAGAVGGDEAMIAEAKNRVLRPLRTGPDFLIVGAQKAGTTSLYHYLAEHPQLRPASGPKELHYFNLYHHRGLAWYLSHFPLRFVSGGRRLSFEATPDYLGHAAVPERIRRDLGRVKLIAVLREPAARAYSAWKMWHSFADHPTKAAKADPRAFAQAIEEELADPHGQADRHFHYVRFGRYAEHLDAYRRHFARDEMLILDHREMSADLLGFLGRICAFLEVEPFASETVARLGARRHWASPDWPETEAVGRTLTRLRAYYAPHNERLFAMLGQRWGW